MDPDIPEIDDLLKDREVFNNFVYTPLGKAMAELNRRRSDSRLKKETLDLLKYQAPEPFLRPKPKGVLFRHLVTPNYETRRFLNLIDSINELDALMLEVKGDKFTSNNKIKYFLGRIGFYKGVNRIGQVMISRETIVDFAIFDGKKIDQVKTLWGQSLVEFHHELFGSFRDIKNIVFDIYDDPKLSNKTALSYYEYVLPLFVYDAVLFENFLIEDREELFFAKNIFLPVFLKIYKTTGLKPLIVPLEPTDIEGDDFWLCYPPETKSLIDKKENML